MFSVFNPHAKRKRLKFSGILDFFLFGFRISSSYIFEVPLSKALDPSGPLNVIFGSISKQTLKNERLNPDSCLLGKKQEH